tara:strand:- start:232 stop:669 length:438 start_codon:yes stop_codon:yes gene_type:complete
MADQHEFQHYRPGISAVGQYQMSGIPFVSASMPVPAIYDEAPLEVGFPYVTKFVTIINTNTGPAAPLRVGFSQLGVTGSGGHAGSNNNYFILNNGESYTGEWRVGAVYLVGDDNATSASIIAGQTGIPTSSVAGWTNWSGSRGVG